MQKPTIAFIGGGTMAASLIAGLMAEHYPADKIWVSNPNEEKLIALNRLYGINTTQNNQEVAKQGQVIILAVKPQHILPVCQEIQNIVEQQKPLILTIAAGITIKAINACFTQPTSIVRCMPNTPAMVRSGITGLFAPKTVNQDQRDIAESIFRAVGVVEWFSEEEHLNAVTAIGGSGPAYFFYLMEILQQQAEAFGIPAKSARLLSIQTALGAARLALESNEDPAILRQQVTSPGGTTAAAFDILRDKQIDTIFSEALRAAQERANALGESLK